MSTALESCSSNGPRRNSCSTSRMPRAANDDDSASTRARKAAPVAEQRSHVAPCTSRCIHVTTISRTPPSHASNINGRKQRRCRIMQTLSPLPLTKPNGLQGYTCPNFRPCIHSGYLSHSTKPADVVQPRSPRASTNATGPPAFWNRGPCHLWSHSLTQ